METSELAAVRRHHRHLIDQMAQRHCDKQEERIVLQRILIARLETASLPTEKAEAFLLKMEDLLAEFQETRERLARNRRRYPPTTSTPAQAASPSARAGDSFLTTEPNSMVEPLHEKPSSGSKPRPKRR